MQDTNQHHAKTLAALLQDLMVCMGFRFTLLESSSGGTTEPPQETARTADLDNRGLLQMQQAVMADQDTELADLEATVGSTKVQLSVHTFTAALNLPSQVFMFDFGPPGDLGMKGDAA